MKNTMILLLGLIAGVTHATAQQVAEWPAAWTEPLEPFPIADGLYYVGSAELASYLLVSDEGHILIDVPMDENVDLVLGNIRRLGFDPADVVLHLASHAHFDHVGGVARMREVTGGTLVLSEAGAELARWGGVGPDAGGRSYPPATADRIIGHLDTVKLGPWTLTAHLTPGHTRGCTSWSLAVAIDGEPLSLVSVCSLTVLPTYRLVAPDPTYPGIARDYCTSVTYLRTLRPDIFLAPHGSFFGLAHKAAAVASGDRRAFVDPERYARYLDRAQASIERALEGQGYQGGCTRLLMRP